MNIKDILLEYLETNGYGGLFETGECGCMLDDLMHCDAPMDCEPGYICEDTKCGKFEKCETVICRWKKTECKYHNVTQEEITE